MDRTSFQDLDIFGPDNSASLFKKLDCTITTGGRMALHTRMSHPFTDAKSIEAIQGTLGCLAGPYEWWAAQFSERQLLYLEKYVGSRIIPFSYRNPWRAHLQALRFRRKYKQEWYFLHTAILHFCSLLQKLHRLFERLEEIPVPLQPLANLLRSLQDPKGAVARFDVKKHSTYTTATVVYLDCFFRKQHKSRCQALINAFFDLDALFSMAHAQEKLGLKTPEIREDDPRVCFEGLYHPLLTTAIPNDFCCHDGKQLLFLTGPNMAGKSTFLKAIGVAVYLGHLGMGVPAASARMPVFDALFVHIHIADDIVAGNSYFQNELNRIHEMAAVLQQSKRVFVAMDELFRGTNINDAEDCAALVIEQLATWKGSFFVISSHLQALAERMAASPDIRFMRFSAKLVGGQPVFNYRLEEGVSTVRLGKVLLHNAGTLKLLQADTRGAHRKQEVR